MADELKRVTLLDMKDPLVELVNHWRAFLKSQLQYFIKMILCSVVDYGKHKVRINFDDYWLESREFTVNVLAKGGRSCYLHPSTLFQNLKQSITELIESACLVKDLAQAFNSLTIEPSEEYLLLPMSK